MNGSGVLTGPQIRAEVEAGNIVIDPWDPDRVIEQPLPVPDRVRYRQVNSGSYDLRLGNRVAVYKNVTMFRVKDSMAYSPARVSEQIEVNPHGALDVRVKQEVHEFEIDPTEGWLLKPGIGYLMHTAERVLSHKYMPLIDGKSSIGRLFLTAHVTAGRGDVGFDGQYTLEVTALYPTRVFPGMRFCQIWFITHVGELLDYKDTGGHYTGQASLGPVPSMAWKQFEEDR